MKNKKNILIIFGILLIFLGAFFPSIRIAQENISFVKENGFLIIVLVTAMFLLLKLNYKQMLYIPSVLSIIIIIKFIIDNTERLKEINELYNCYASFEYGLIVMLLGNILILITTTLELLNIDKLKTTTKKLKQKTNTIINVISNKVKTIKVKFIDNKQKIKELIKTKKQNITYETTKDGKIRFNKITIKCDKPVKIKPKTSLKEKIQAIKLKIKTFHPFRKKLSISNYRDEKTNKVTHNISVIDIKKWTRSNICCSNCGATISTNSEYCFLCDCKIKLKETQTS